MKKIKQLTDIINKANYDYYALDNPSISDQEYDRYMNELIELENKYPQYATDTSPTKRVGGVVIDSFTKVHHNKPMLSLSNVFNNDEVIAFVERLKNEVQQPKYVVELKIDGLAVSLIYKQGKLLQAITRGDGIIGEDITHNIVTIKTIPLVLPEPIDIEVRGEVYMTKKVFNQINVDRIAKDIAPLLNPRNAAAGSIRQLDSKIAASRNLSCFIYTLVEAEKKGFSSHYEALLYLKSLGFAINDNTKKINDIDELVTFISNWEEKRFSLDYEIDGLVIKLDDLNEQEKIGTTARYPKWATAYKFQAQEVTTRIKDIIFTVGRTGQITPNAVLEPVRVAGSIVSKATLHNEDYIKERDIRVNDMVVVRKAGDIIPEVVRVLFDRREEQLNEFKMINKCPICEEAIVRLDNLAGFYCVNDNCDARNQEGLIHFVSRNAMNIEGFGERIIEDFYNMDFLKSADDFYKLKNYKNELMELEGFGEKSINKLLNNIEASKNKSLDKLLFALGIRHVGEKTSKELAKEFKTINNLMEADYDKLIQIKDVGDVIAGSVIDYFSKENNVKLINNLKHHGLNMKYINNIIIENELFLNKTFVLTGALTNITRDEANQVIEKLGGNVTNTVSKKTDVLVMGTNPGSKYDKAKKLNIVVWGEAEFLKNSNN